MKPFHEYVKYQDNIPQLIDDDDCYLDNITNFLQIDILKFCGCGNPEENLLLVHDLLTMNKENKKISDGMTSTQLSLFYEENQEKLKQYVHEHWKRFINFFWYVMDQKEIMEHGSSILSGWIRNHNFLDALIAWKNQYDKNKSENIK